MEHTEADFLKGYSPEAYPRPSVAADVLAFTTEGTRLQLLLIRRHSHPYLGRWALPGGFIGMKESAEEAAIREFREKTGISGIYMEQLYTFSGVRRDPRMRIISVAYLAMAAKERLLPALDREGTEAGLFTVQADDARGFVLTPDEGDGAPVFPEELAFDHAEIIATALNRMAGKLEYTDIGFEFLADKGRFTLSELYDIYTAVSGRQYDLPNFRRFIKKRYEEAGRIEPTGERQKKRGTPAALYRWQTRP